MKRIATIAITPETVNFVLRDATGEILTYSFPTTNYRSAQEIVRDVARPRGTVDHITVGAVWTDAISGKRIQSLDWPPFRADEVEVPSVCKHVELTNETDATLAMLRQVQDELTSLACPVPTAS